MPDHRPAPQPLQHAEMMRRRLRGLEDADLLELVADGDARGLEVFCERFARRIGGFLERLVGPGWVDDLVQETLVRVYQNAEQYDPQWSVAAWVFGIARHLALDLLRREGRHQRRMVAAAVPEELPSTMQQLHAREFEARLEEAIAELGEPFRSVFLLREREGLSYEDCARVLETSVKTVSSRLHRARSQLRDKLKGFLDS